MSTPAPDPARIGGDLVAESLYALGARRVFGLPGQHALGAFDALRRSPLAYTGLRTEHSAGFAADAYARTTGDIAPLLVSTGPGALMSLPALQESAAASAPVLAVGSQVPTAGLGGGRRGHLHELADQQAAFRDVVKSVHTVRAAGQIPSALAAARAVALSPPHGPVWVEIPQDVLLSPASVPPPEPAALRRSAEPSVPGPRPELTAEAAALLEGAHSPAVLAGGGVVRAGAQAQLRALAERLDAPVATTFGGKGAFPWEHPLSLRSWLEDRHTTDFLADADVLLVVGSGLGELSSNYHTFAPRGRVVQIEADLGKLEANHPALGIHADARLALEALTDAVRGRTASDGAGDGAGDGVGDGVGDGAGDGVGDEARDGARRAAGLLERVAARIASQGLEFEQDLLASVRAALPDTAPSCWDMTVLGYWAWSAFDPRGGAMHSGQGAGGLGYGFPGALGVAAADPGAPVLAVSGDGGAMYSLAELATARQHDAPVTWLIVDDGGYGILRDYMADAFGEAVGTELARPDFVALAESFGVPGVRTTPERLTSDLAAALASDGPSVVVLPAQPRMFAPTHLGG